MRIPSARFGPPLGRPDRKPLPPVATPTLRLRPASRQQQLLELLRSGCVTAKPLATRLGVCVRTIYRDVAALRAEGYRVLAIGGRRGGFWLDPDGKPRPLGLTADELRQVVLAVAAASGDANEILERLLQAFPEVRAERLRQLLAPILNRPGLAVARRQSLSPL